MGVTKRWQQARTGMAVAEYGTGKTLISLGPIHVHSDGNPFPALTVVPPNLVECRVNEVRLKRGCIVREVMAMPLVGIRTFASP